MSDSGGGGKAAPFIRLRLGIPTRRGGIAEYFINVPDREYNEQVAE
ncbi:MAG: hypothetical protein P1P89_18385 [Desulfobacterales bacterium]|nr:hypothetical protein [Desulfobacterales bacterium]